MKGSLLLLLLMISISLSSPLETIYEWKSIDYLWSSHAQKEEAIKNGDYDPTAPLPIDVDKAKDGRVFVTLIRNEGVPATLTTVSDTMGPTGPLLTPYPNWEWNKLGDCKKLTNVYRVAIDECNRLWVLDTGRIGSDLICPAQLLTFNLTNDELIQRIEIPHFIAANATGVGLLVTPVVDTEGPRCERTTVYMADADGFGLVIWNGHRIFRLEAPEYDGDEAHSNFTIAGESFTLLDGPIGMALTPRTAPFEPRMLIFRPLSSVGLYMASTWVLTRSHDGRKVKYGGSTKILPSQASVHGISSEGTFFFGMTTELAIGCWNIYKPLLKKNFDVAVTDEVRLQFASGLKVIPQKITQHTEEVWILTNRIQKVLVETQNFNEINFRVMRSSVTDLIKGTRCSMPNKVLSKEHPPLGHDLFGD